MNVLLISQCDKKALTESRRILDQFAERRGERTWQTPITQAGLDTLRRLLRKTARKNTAVACHWIRGRDHSELLWIVGDARRFNADGAVPTNTTTRDVLRRKDENDWHSLQAIHLLSALAALLHDLGKSCRAFQQRLTSTAVMERNQYRHEWISLRLFQAFVGDDQDDRTWLERLINPSDADDASWLDRQRLRRDGCDPEASRDKPFARLPPMARAVGWLVLTHHRLPVMPPDTSHNDSRPRLGSKLDRFQSGQLYDLLQRIDCRWNELPSETRHDIIEPYWTFPHGLPVTVPAWRKRAARIAKRLLDLMALPDHHDWTADPYVMHLARLGLMLADHHYSRLSEVQQREHFDPNYPLHANTRDGGVLNQKLDEHLLGVAKHSAIVAHALPGFADSLPRLVRHKGLRQRSADPRYRWQDRATDTATGMRERAARQGAFIVNMASTGRGKTLANARIMNALADPAKGMRCAFALGLRTLTLQTGQAFRDLLNLSDDQLAVRVGGAANRELFELRAEEAERTGSASTLGLIPEDGGVLFEGNDQHPLLQRLTHEPRVRALLAAPLLVCTVDHLTPATESQRGGHQIVPMLRLMSGDLVLDEPDDFDLTDLPALTRLVHWAGLLGARVLLSSATLPPALVEGLFLAYLDGRVWFQRNRGDRPGEQQAVCCAWFDEFDQQQIDSGDADGFRSAHLEFAQRRHQRLDKETARRRGELLPLSLVGIERSAIRTEFAGKLREAALRLHKTQHGIDPHSGKRISFGLVRMANIDPLFDVALALYRQGAPDGVRIHLCVYHARFPLLIRSDIERRLDLTLDRKRPDAVFARPEIRHALDSSTEPDQLFVVLASPVAEVGRDHDYDWAVVEPSSMRSLIQLAGRVRRHRDQTVTNPNIMLFNSNLRHFEHPHEPAFCKPGFEGYNSDQRFRLLSHALSDLLEPHEYQIIDARPRLLPRPQSEWQPTRRLTDLEHARLADTMLPSPSNTQPLSDRDIRLGHRTRPPTNAANAASQWRVPQVWLSAVLPQQQPFRAETFRQIELVLLPNEDEDDYVLHRIEPTMPRRQSLYIPIENSMLCRIPDAALSGPGIQPWGETDYLRALTTLAESRDEPLDRCAKRYGTVTVPASEHGWRFHPALGFGEAK